MQLPASAGYLGLMGSRARRAKLLAELAKEGLPADARLHRPVVLDLVGIKPEASALPVLAEIQACLLGRSGPSLGTTLAAAAQPCLQR